MVWSATQNSTSFTRGIKSRAYTRAYGKGENTVLGDRRLNRLGNLAPGIFPVRPEPLVLNVVGPNAWAKLLGGVQISWTARTIGVARLSRSVMPSSSLPAGGTMTMVRFSIERSGTGRVAPL